MKARLPLACLSLAAGLAAAEAPPAAPVTPAAPATTTAAAPKTAPAAPGAVSLSSLPPSALVTKMKQVRACLDDVFKIRSADTALPDLRQNPFRIPGAPAETAQASAGSAGGSSATPAPETEAGRLRRLVGTLSFGLIERPGQPVLVSLNSTSYKEGDVLRVTDTAANAPVLLRIRKIAGKSVTFGLGNSEYTVTK
jgi:hypothetical protein